MILFKLSLVVLNNEILYNKSKLDMWVLVSFNFGLSIILQPFSLQLYIISLIWFNSLFAWHIKDNLSYFLELVEITFVLTRCTCSTNV